MAGKIKYTLKVGETYGLWTTISKTNGRYEMWLCRCACGTVKEVLKGHLYEGRSTNCGCVRNAKVGNINRSHQMSGTKEYRAWRAMQNRCYNENSEDFHRYNSRGITVCDEWLASFENFYSDMGDAPVTGERWSVGRIDNDLGYSHSNCQWEVDVQQARNKAMFSNNVSGITGVHERTRSDNGKSYFVACWHHNGKKHSREFSVNKYGYVRAKELAIATRESAIRQINSETGMKYSDKHGL